MLKIIGLIVLFLVVGAAVYYFGFYKRGKINDRDGDFIPDEIEDAADSTKTTPEVRRRLERETRRSGFAHPARGVFELFLHSSDGNRMGAGREVTPGATSHRQTGWPRALGSAKAHPKDLPPSGRIRTTRARRSRRSTRERRARCGPSPPPGSTLW